jgi:hypothetical protein
MKVLPGIYLLFGCSAKKAICLSLKLNNILANCHVFQSVSFHITSSTN